MALTGGEVTAGEVIIFVQLMNFVIEPISQVPQMLANRKAANALIEKLAKAIATNTRDGGIHLDNQLNGGIRFENVSFGYEPSQLVLKNVSWDFKQGKSYAIVGAFGSGKSTLLNLLMGTSAEYEGEIRYDQAELRSIQTDSLYELASIIQQNVFIFNDSILNNITMYHEFSELEIENAANMSGLTPLIREKTREYLCGENGSNLSGGERQRVSNTRCLLRKTPVLLVDEATASLDSSTAYSIKNSILRLSSLTRIMVTQQLEDSLLRQYDAILVMRQGRLEESGTFEELMAKRTYFYSLFNVAQDARE